MRYPAIALSLLLSLPAMADEQLPPDTNMPCLTEAIAIYKQAGADNPTMPHDLLIAIGSARYQQCIGGPDKEEVSLNRGSGQ